MATVDGPVSAGEMSRIAVCALWDDGRVGSEWCRFDAMVDAARRLRAEVTWDDDGDFDGSSGEPTVYFAAQLWLETNRPETPLSGEDGLVTWDGVRIDLGREEALALVAGPPAAVLERYADQVASLRVWSPADGYPDPQD